MIAPEVNMNRPKKHSDRWYGWALVAIAALVFTNAGWYYRWKVRAAEHVETVNDLLAKQPKAEPRVIYEYRQPQSRPQQRAQATRDLVAGEECRSGVIIRRSPNGLESTGEPCR